MVVVFSIENKDLKNYPHFDAPLSRKEIQRIVTSPERVSTNRFFPLLSYVQQWQPYRSGQDGKPKRKERPIRYASRRDAYIYAHYRRILLEKYEARLAALGISECPIAYRQIVKDAQSEAGKCNIDFAKHAVDKIKALGDCVAIALDIKGYFENLDHRQIKSLWKELLGVAELPPDHFAVFKNITKYHHVDRKEAYRRLGYLAKLQVNGFEIESYTVPYKDMPKRLCTSQDFRDKICGGDPALPSLIETNPEEFGIPQGAPISDLIANLYLMYFDKAVFDYVQKRGGRYMRYSDDILLILPGGEPVAQDARNFVIDEIKKYGPQVRIKDEKTCVVQFMKTGNVLSFRHIDGPQGKNGFEYLGFRFDGHKVYVRDSTISRFYRKVAIGARREAIKHFRNNPGLDILKLQKSFNYTLLSQRFTRVNRTDFVSDDVRTWTFWTYLKRAAKAFGDDGSEILKQASGFRKFMHERVDAALAKILIKATTGK